MSTNSFPIVIKYRFGWFMMLTLAVIFVLGMVVGVTDAIWRLSPSWLFPLGCFAIITGWVAGGTQRRDITCFITGIISGVLLLILYQSEAYRDVYRAYYFAQETQIQYNPLIVIHPNAGPSIYHLYRAVNNLISYFLQLSHWFRNLIVNQTYPNITAINLIWGSLLWSVLFSMGWLLRRKIHAFLASLPALTLVAGVIGYTRKETTGLIVTLGAVLALMILSEQLKREHQWYIQKVDYSEEIRFDLLTYSIPLLGLIVVLASFLPNFSLNNIRSLLNLHNQAASERQVDLTTSLGLDQEPIAPIAGIPQVGLPRSHLIGSGTELSELKIMEISPGEIFLPPQVDPSIRLPTYYWFGHAFEYYTGTGWKNSEIQEEIFQADQLIPAVEWPEHHLVNLSFLKTDIASPTLYFTGLLHTVNQTITISRHETTQEFLFGHISAKQYQVIAAIADLPEEQLRQSAFPPPEVIQETYLQLPPGITDRVVALANQVTQQATTPYDKAKSIEAYLRQYEYTLDLPSPPQNREIVDYFLFDLQKGYCDYYATTMVILARLSGLPARFVIGYGPGLYDYNQQRFIVTEANAHAWPEIYVEPFGWVPFEPTASFSPRVLGTDSEEVFSSTPIFPEEIHPGRTVPNLHLTWSIPLLTIFLVGIWWLMRRRKQKITPTITQIESVYYSTRTYLTHLFFELQTEHTPQEFKATYANYLLGLNGGKMIQKLTRHVIRHLSTITYLYEEGVYSPREIWANQVIEARKNLGVLRICSLLLKAVYSFKII